MTDYLKYFFNLNHLFSLRPQAMTPRAVIILAVIFGLLIILALIDWFLIKKTKDALKIKGYRRLMHLKITMAILGFVYLFFAWQGVALLGSRFWLLIWLIVNLVWLFYIGQYLFKTVPKLRRDIDKKRKFEQYLP